MSYAEIFRESYAVAKKSHICSGCEKEIKIGEKYFRITGKWDGDFASYPYHKDCRDWEDHLNNGCYPDEWLPLSDLIDCDDALEGAPASVIERFSRHQSNATP